MFELAQQCGFVTPLQLYFTWRTAIENRQVRPLSSFERRTKGLTVLFIPASDYTRL